MNKGTAVLKILVLFLIIASVISTLALAGYGYFWMKAEKRKAEVREAELAKFRESNTRMESQLKDLGEARQALETQNAQLKADTEKFENQKNVILNQVRTSVEGFDTFRRDAANEIAKLKDTASALEKEKSELANGVKFMKSASDAEKEALHIQIERLNKRLGEVRAAAAALGEDLKKKERETMVVETSKLHYNLGNYYFRHRQYKAAVREYKKAVFYDPDNADAHYNLAVTSDDYLGDYRTAIEHYKKFLELNPKTNLLKKIQQKVLDLELHEKVVNEPQKEKVIEPFEVNEEPGLSKWPLAKDKNTR